MLLLSVVALAGCGGSNSAPRAGGNATGAATISSGAKAKKAKPVAVKAKRTTPPHGARKSLHPVATARTGHVVAPGGPDRGKTTTYTGIGDTTIPEIKLARDAVLHWTVSGGSFSARDSTGKFRAAGRGRNGQTFVASGDYREVKVVASGSWTLKIQLLSAPA
jgi:hypothetical protein